MESSSIYQSQKVFLGSKTGPLPKLQAGGRYFFKAESFECPAKGVLQNNMHLGLSLYFEIIWVLKGTATVNTGSHTYEISQNVICSFSAGKPYTISSGEHLHGYRISFSQEFLFITGTETSSLFLETVYPKHNIFFSLDINAHIKPKMQEVLQAMIKESAGNLDFRSELLKGLLRIFLIYFKRLSQSSPLQLPGTDTAIFTRFKNLVKENFTAKKTVAEYARDLDITQNYLNEVIKKVSGYTASYHIQQQILFEAKRLAVQPGLSMKQIAYHLGFLDTAHFSKFFTKKSGMNFTDFKKQIGQ